MLFSKGLTSSYTPLHPDQTSPAKEAYALTAPTTESWYPFWMRRLILILFMLSFAAVIAALEILNLISARNNGLATTGMSYHYFWTYGPTAIFTLFLALWNRVDYRVRQMTPWISMYEHSSVVASQCIFLDYLSPTMPEILWHSLKNCHFGVTSSTMVVNLITILMIISTSLFSLEPRPTRLTDVNYHTTSSFARNKKLSSASLLPSYILDGIDYWNLTYPFGVTPEYAYQSLELADNKIPWESLQEAKTEVILPGLECEEARLVFVSWSFSWMWTDCDYNVTVQKPQMSTVAGTNATLNLTSSDCTIKMASPFDPLMAYASGINGEVGNFAVFASQACVQNFSEYRIVLMFGEAQQHGDVGPYPPDRECLDEAPIADIEILRSKQWICKPSIKFAPGNVTFNSTELARGILPQVAMDQGTQPQSYPNVTNGDLTYQMVTIARAPFGGDDTGVILKGDAAKHYAEMRVLRPVDTDSLEDLLTTDLYQNLSIAHYKRQLSMAAHVALNQKETIVVQGTAVVSHNRLSVRQVPLRILEAISGVILLCVLSLVIILPAKSVVSCDPARLSNLLVILDHSPTMAQTFSQTGSLSLRALETSYTSQKYTSSFVPEKSSPVGQPKKNHLTFKITSDNVSKPESTDSDEIVWWRPYTIMATSRIAASVVVSGLILTILVLVLLSNQRQGLVSVSLSGYSSAAWTIFPAVTMSGVAMYVRALNTIYKVFGPFSLLRKGVKTARILSRNYLSMTEIEVLFHTEGDRQGGLSFMSVATMLTAFLTIAVSGVFTVLPVPTIDNAEIVLQSWFTDAGSDDDGTLRSNGIISGLALISNLSYPQWTYEDLAMAYPRGSCAVHTTATICGLALAWR